MIHVTDEMTAAANAVVPALTSTTVRQMLEAAMQHNTSELSIGSTFEALKRGDTLMFIDPKGDHGEGATSAETKLLIAGPRGQSKN